MSRLNDFPSGEVPTNFKQFLLTHFAIRMSADNLWMSARIDQYEIWSTGCQYIISVSALNGIKKSWVVKKTARTLAEADTGLIGTEWDAKRELFFASKG